MTLTQPRLVDRYLAFPASVLDRRGARWKALRARWAHLGDVGRDGVLYRESNTEVGEALHTYSQGASRFDPALAHLLTHWYTRPGDTVVDPFAGGPIRGMVTTELDRAYHGVDLNPHQVEANHQAHPDHTHLWEVGDATTWQAPHADMVLTCPPYHQLERYSDDPADLSVMGWDEFTTAIRATVTNTLTALHPDRYTAWVVSDVRDRNGQLRDLPGEVVRAHQQAGALWLDDLVTVDPIGAGRLRAKRPFVRSRKTLRTHQRALVFVKGDPTRAAWRIYDQADTPDRAWNPTHAPPA